jgi:hypothetical protein
MKIFKQVDEDERTGAPRATFSMIAFFCVCVASPLARSLVQQEGNVGTNTTTTTTTHHLHPSSKHLFLKNNTTTKGSDA